MLAPGHVLELREISPADYERLGWFTQRRVRRHGMQVVYTVRPDECLSCGQCLEACREQAIHKKPSVPKPAGQSRRK